LFPCRSRQKAERSEAFPGDLVVESYLEEDAMTTTATQTRSQTPTQPAQLFKRVLVGVDRSPDSIEAARQAAILTEPNGMLTLLAAWTVPPPTTIGGVGPTFAPELDAGVYREPAASAVGTAEAAIAPIATPETRIVRGTAWEVLIDEIEHENDALVAVGSHGQGRLHGILVGSTATELVHKAPCSVLVARAAGGSFPRRIVVGIDGSPQSALAYAAARRFAIRFASKVWPVVAHGGKGIDKHRVAAIVGFHYEDLPEEPVTALVAASADADLVMVGSRGLHGFKALGSVSERVAHRAHCSTLIVR
jgi:nucleotide-binding universal stress UspA family protein